ncbi:MAG: hypothetical protein ACOX5Z_02115 [Desulfobulbus sp.]
MKKIYLCIGCLVAAGLLSGCGATTVKPNYTSEDPQIMRIGGEMPSAAEAEVLNLGSYCVQVRDQWKEDGKTPDGQQIWTKDSFRRVVPCP